MPQSRASYHHGGLRDALLAACVALIESDGIAAVSLRRVARDAGVSPGAPYHHFPDRAALFAAIAVQGHELLLERLRAARAAAPTPVRALGAVLAAYVAFARERPGHVHLMLRSELSTSPHMPEAAHAGEPALRLLTETVQDCQRDGSAPPGDPEPLVAAVWALAIGIVTLWLDGPLEGRCVDLGTTPEALTGNIAALLETLLTTYRTAVRPA